MGFNKIIFLFLSFILTDTSLAITKAVQKLVEFETHANAVSVRSSEMSLLPHVEIPLRLVGVDFASRLDPFIAESLVFKKNGESYVRWILNPEDTKWGLEVIKHFKMMGLDLTVKRYYRGYQTASRSYIAEDPVNGAQFSVKSSTNVTGGAWKDKKQPVGEAIDGRLLSDFLFEQSQKRPFENFIIMDEPAILKLEAIDQAVVIRDLNLIKNPDSGKYFLPGFSALYESVGRNIALKNGSNDVERFWVENYIKVAGRALGELAARTGIQFDSPHSQNFLIELDSDYKPTGKLVLRDMSDLYVDLNYLKALSVPNNKILRRFNQKENMLDHIAAGFGPLHGNSFPSWVNPSQYSNWKTVFFKEFESTFQAISGYDLLPLKAPQYQIGAFFRADYHLKFSSKLNSLFEMMSADGVVHNFGGQRLCRFIF